MDNCILSISDKAGNDNSIAINIIDTTIAPLGEESNWDYNINENNETITLKYHNKFDEKTTIVYSNYIINNKTYKTVIANNDEDSKNNYLFSNNYLIESVFFGKDIDCSKIKNVRYMFNDCQCLKFVNLSNFNSSNVNNMNSMFFGCRRLKTIIWGNFDTSNVKDMAYMFNGNESLESLDLTSFDTRNVKMITSIFKDCLKLTSIKVSRNNWDLSHIVEEYFKLDMFDNCGTSEVTYV